MTYEEHRRTEIRERVDPARPVDPYASPVDPYATRDDRIVHDDRIVTARPSSGELLSRLVLFVFGVIQLVIALRILFLAIGAREGNEIVAFVLALSRPLVAPFEGMLGTDALGASGALLDTTAFIALIGWTVLEVILLAFLRLLRREPV